MFDFGTTSNLPALLVAFYGHIDDQPPRITKYMVVVDIFNLPWKSRKGPKEPHTLYPLGREKTD